MTPQLATLAQTMIPAVETEMRQVMGANGQPGDAFDGMIHYHMGWADVSLQPSQVSGGKRIRPLLCLLCCQAAGGSWEQAVPAAAAIEILHNFTLAHDDIQDGSPTRRGRPTLWKLWGAAQAINSGDAMFAQAHLAMCRLGQQGVAAPVVLQALRRLDETCLELTRGQYADMAFETRQTVSVAEYLAMIRGKTAALIALSAELGALIAGSPAETGQQYATAALNLGLAFQVRDDILGIWGDEARIGKSAATDIETRKKTLPVLFGLGQSEALRRLYEGENAGTEFVPRAMALLEESGARAYAEEQEAHYTQLALHHLAAAQPAGNALHDLVAYLLGRPA